MKTKLYDHGPLQQIFPNIFMVTGVNYYDDKHGEQQQHSRNMIIVRENDSLSLINSVRLTEEGLQELDKLGSVRNIIRIGAFHGKDDLFYLERYQASLWALPGMKHEHSHPTDMELTPDEPKPFSDCSVFIFENSREPEAILHVNRENGILVSCDSLKNWLEADQFFSQKTALLYERAGFFGRATVSKIWRDTCQVQLSDFMQLNQFDFQHLLSAHGEALLNFDKELLLGNIQIQYGHSSKL